MCVVCVCVGAIEVEREKNVIVVVMCVRGVLVSVPVRRGGVCVGVCVYGVCGCDVM